MTLLQRWSSTRKTCTVSGPSILFHPVLANLGVETDGAMVESGGAAGRKPYLSIPVDDAGYPMLPPPEEWPSKVTGRKALVRAFVALAYSELHHYALC